MIQSKSKGPFTWSNIFLMIDISVFDVFQTCHLRGTAPSMGAYARLTVLLYIQYLLPISETLSINV